MDSKELVHIYGTHPGVEALIKLAKAGKAEKSFIGGLTGSSAAVVLAAFNHRVTHQSVLVVMGDAEEAGYFYHDLMQSGNNDNILFFPSSFRRAIKYGHEDEAGRILRTEVLSRLTNRKSKEGLLIVSHPDAIAEKVVSQSDLKEKSITISIGDNISRDKLESQLSGFGFKEFSYVYEPGEFAVGGSLIDIYSYS